MVTIKFAIQTNCRYVTKVLKEKNHYHDLNVFKIIKIYQHLDLGTSIYKKISNLFYKKISSYIIKLIVLLYNSVHHIHINGT